MDNYYKILGIDMKASLGEIAEAFKIRFAQVLKLPPSAAVESTKQKLKVAVTTLGNIQKRNRYDKLIAFQIKKEESVSRAKRSPRLVTEMSVQCKFCPSNTYMKDIDMNKEYQCFHCGGTLEIPIVIICNMCDQKVIFEGEVIPCTNCKALLHPNPVVLQKAKSDLQKKYQLTSAKPGESIESNEPSSASNQTESPRSSKNNGEFASENRPVQPIVAGEMDAVVDALKKLKQLVDTEVITAGEFEKKKRELLARI